MINYIPGFSIHDYRPTKRIVFVHGVLAHSASGPNWTNQKFSAQEYLVSAFEKEYFSQLTFDGMRKEMNQKPGQAWHDLSFECIRGLPSEREKMVNRCNAYISIWYRRFGYSLVYSDPKFTIFLFL